MNIEKAEILFRAATQKDIQELRRFEQGVVAAERPFDPTLKEGAIQYHDIEAMLNSDQAQFIVAQRGSELIACGFARIDDAKPYLSHAKQAYLGLMYVDPEYRGQSINGAIVERLKQWCLAKGVTELRLEVYCHNLAAIAAYEKVGFSQHMVEMRVRL